MFDIYSTFNRNSNTEAVSSVLYGKKNISVQLEKRMEWRSW